jgi:hypothetical protein
MTGCKQLTYVWKMINALLVQKRQVGEAPKEAAVYWEWSWVPIFS